MYDATLVRGDAPSRRCALSLLAFALAAGVGSMPITVHSAAQASRQRCTCKGVCRRACQRRFPAFQSSVNQDHLYVESATSSEAKHPADVLRQRAPPTTAPAETRAGSGDQQTYTQAGKPAPPEARIVIPNEEVRRGQYTAYPAHCGGTPRGAPTLPPRPQWGGVDRASDANYQKNQPPTAGRHANS